MKAVEVRVRKIGTSYGVIIPNDVLDDIDAKENDAVILKIERQQMVKDIRGMCPGLGFEREHHVDNY